jgi:hypothetical protein
MIMFVNNGHTRLKWRAVIPIEISLSYDAIIPQSADFLTTESEGRWLLCHRFLILISNQCQQFVYPQFVLFLTFNNSKKIPFPHPSGLLALQGLPS